MSLDTYLWTGLRWVVSFMTAKGPKAWFDQVFVGLGFLSLRRLRSRCLNVSGLHQVEALGPSRSKVPMPDRARSLSGGGSWPLENEGPNA